MKKQKLNLSELKVTSLITNPNQDVKGGYESPYITVQCGSNIKDLC